MTFVLVTGEIDLSVGSMVAVASVVFGMLLEHGVPIWGAILADPARGLRMGAVNGILSIALRVPTIIITLGMLNAYRGLADQIANGYPIAELLDAGGVLGYRQQAALRACPVRRARAGRLRAVAGYVLRRTTTGLHVYAMGSHRRAAELAGLHVNRIRMGVLIFNGLAAGIAALLAVAQAQTADPNLGTGYELDAIAAVIIGGAKLAGGAGTVLGSVLGLLLIGMIQNGLVIVGVSIYLLVVVSGLVVIAAVAIDRFFARRREVASERLTPLIPTQPLHALERREMHRLSKANGTSARLHRLASVSSCGGGSRRRGNGQSRSPRARSRLGRPRRR